MAEVLLSGCVSFPDVSSRSQRISSSAATAVAVVAVLGSVGFQYGLGYQPCELCHVQRWLMIGLAVLATLSLRHRPTAASALGALVGLVGAGVAAYHVRLQLTTTDSVACTAADGGIAGAGCGTIDYQLAGIVTIPALSLGAFAVATVLLVGSAYAGIGDGGPLVRLRSERNRW